ncbi:MAG TPA: PAS domain-containing protein [Polyangiaceae bacterium]|nr:PAS domain-containing protein [Polyangiaceae bacterium]
MAEFWITMQGVDIRYFAVRDAKGTYLGTLEVVQDVTSIKRLEGERRLLNEA